MSPRLFGCAIVAALALLALYPGQLAPSSETIAADRPHPEEIRLLDELALWTGASDQHPRSPFPGDASLTDSVSSRAESFALFVDAGPATSNELLAGLPFGALIERTARRHRLDALLVAAVIETESAFNPDATSHRGALGLMQVTPQTALELGFENALDPAQNVEAGARYLRQMLRRFRGDLPLALAAYNAGPGAVLRFGGIPPYRETTSYVEKVLRLYLDHRQAAWQAEAIGGLLNGS